MSRPELRSTEPAAPPPKARKLSFKEQRELDGLPERIAALETEQQAIATQLADGTLYATDNARALGLAARSAQIDVELLAALERWEALGAPARNQPAYASCAPTAQALGDQPICN